MNLVVEFYGNNQARVTLTNSYQDGDKTYGRSQEAFANIKYYLENHDPKINVDQQMTYVQLENQQRPGPCGIYACHDAQMLSEYLINDNPEFKTNGLLNFDKIKADMLKKNKYL